MARSMKSLVTVAQSASAANLEQPMNSAIKTWALLSVSILTVTVAHAVDGVRLITHADVMAGGITPGDAPGYPATLSRRGSYRLASNLRVTDPNTHAVLIASEDVTLDLNGFTIQGPGGSGSGAGVFAAVGAQGQPRIAVRNGVVMGMGNYGVVVGSDSDIRDLRIRSNGAGGIFVTGGTSGGIVTENAVTENAGPGLWLLCSGCVVSNNTAVANAGIGIFVGGGAVIKSNTSLNNASHGLFAANGSVVIGNTARDNAGLGFQLDGDAGYKENVLTANNGDSANPQVDGGIQIGLNICGTDTTCP
jgi:Right handed beta helix region